MGLGIEHRQHKGLNNRAENSHLPTRRRERIMKRFKSPRQVQKFLSIHDQVANLFHFPRKQTLSHRLSRRSRSGLLGLDRDRGHPDRRMMQSAYMIRFAAPSRSIT